MRYIESAVAPVDCKRLGELLIIHLVIPGSADRGTFANVWRRMTPAVSAVTCLNPSYTPAPPMATAPSRLTLPTLEATLMAVE